MIKTGVITKSASFFLSEWRCSLSLPRRIHLGVPQGPVRGPIQSAVSKYILYDFYIQEPGARGMPLQNPLSTVNLHHICKETHIQTSYAFSKRRKSHIEGIRQNPSPHRNIGSISMRTTWFEFVSNMAWFLSLLLAFAFHFFFHLPQ